MLLMNKGVSVKLTAGSFSRQSSRVGAARAGQLILRLARGHRARVALVGTYNQTNLESLS